jgi:hypothetical protein
MVVLVQDASAFAAATQGRQVVVLEATALIGGSTAISGGIA